MCWIRTFRSVNHVGTVISIGLQTVHPNPGPRNKTEEGKLNRRTRRYERRKEKREARLLNQQQQQQQHQQQQQNRIDHLKVLTWNLQRMSIGTRNNRKLKSVADYANKQKIDVILISEVNSSSHGVTWLGEEDCLTAIIHSERAAILLRGDSLQKWCQDGQKSKFNERSVSVKFDKYMFTATYMPVWHGNNAEDIEIQRSILKEHASWARQDEIIIIGGDFNAHIGGGENRPGVCGNFGLRQTNHQGHEFLEWLEDNNLCYVNSFFNHKRRGTWFNPALRRWYELDGFVMRSQDRHKLVRKVRTIGEASLSDHLPKKLELNLVKKKYTRNQRKKPPPKIAWEKLQQENVALAFKNKVNELLEVVEADMEDNIDRTQWNEITNVVMSAAKEVCGESVKQVENPWMSGRDEEVQQMRVRITAAVGRRNELLQQIGEEQEEQVRVNLEADLTAARNELKEARKDLKRRTSNWEKQWWETIINECNDASQRNDAGLVYRNLRKLGSRGLKKAPTSSTLTKEAFKIHFEGISKERFENPPEEVMAAVDQMEDISQTEVALQYRELLDETPSREEIVKQMKEMSDSAPGEDGVRLIYILKGGPALIDTVVEMIRFMFENPAEKWEESLKVGLVIPLHKKGNRNVEHNYRGVCLLAMGSRILARILASRLRIWSEKVGLLDDDQAGFRAKRSTADITQIFYRIQEDTKDWLRRAEKAGIQIDEERRPAARLLDLRKAYPRVNKPALWRILEKYGMGERCLRAVKDLHETTVYKVKSREGCSDEWTPNRGLREGCPSSPPLFNIFHQVVMRLAAKARKRKAEEMENEVGISMRWIPGSSFPSQQAWEKDSSEAKRVRIDRGLFADDTTIAGKKKELEDGVRETKIVMGHFEERNNDDKEEICDFGTAESNNIRMLGVWLGEEEDVRQRLKRAGGAWIKIKSQLKGSKMSKKKQAKIVEACVESTLLFDCATRTWQQREIKRLQSCMDKKYRYIWSRKTGPPLVQMQQEHKNMWDVRRELGVKSVRYKIEKRVLERVGHVMRMEDDRTVKAAVLGWLEELESTEKLPGRKRKTQLYWKQMLREAQIDTTDIGRLTQDRKVWKGLVRTRMAHIDQWERSGGHGVEEERGSRVSPTPEQPDVFVCDFEGCDKVCASKAGLTNHRRRMHEVSKEKVEISCGGCGIKFDREANLNNHLKSCSGVVASDPDMKKCNNCHKEIRRSNFRRHFNVCGGQLAQTEPARPKKYIGATYICEGCGLERAKTNRAKHRRICQGGP